MPWLGVLASSAVVVGRPASPWALAACYVIYLSLDRPMVLVYPWDCALFEAGFWGMLLPATRFHTVRYAGVLAGASKWRPLIVPKPAR